MVCPHCGFEAPAGATQCMSCGYPLVPPSVRPKRKRTLLMFIIVIGLFGAAFVVIALEFRGQSARSSISFFGKRAHFDFGRQLFTLAPGAVGSVSLRNPPRTPVCRIYGRMGAAPAGAQLLVLDSANLALLSSGERYSALIDSPARAGESFDAQTEGAGVAFHVAVRNAAGGTDSTRIEIESMRASCYEKW